MLRISVGSDVYDYFVMNVKHHGVTGSFQIENTVHEAIAGDGLSHIFRKKTAVHTLL
jgi:hypothetical protein